MAKKGHGKGKTVGPSGILSLPAGAPLIGTGMGSLAGEFDVDAIKANLKSSTIADQRAEILKQIGVRRPHQKYKNATERKAAQKVLAKQRREREKEALKPFGMAPEKKPKRTEAQKKQYRKDYQKKRNAALKDILKDNPDLREKYGFKKMKFL